MENMISPRLDATRSAAAMMSAAIVSALRASDGTHTGIMKCRRCGSEFRYNAAVRYGRMPGVYCEDCKKAYMAGRRRDPVITPGTEYPEAACR